MRQFPLMVFGLALLITCGFTQRAHAQNRQSFPSVRGEFHGVNRGAVLLVKKDGEKMAIPLRKSPLWLVSGKAEPGVLSPGMVVSAEGPLDYSKFYQIRNASLIIYANGSFESYRYPGFNDRGGKLLVVGHVVSVNPLKIKATKTDIVGIKRFANGQTVSYPIRGAIFQAQPRAGLKTIPVKFGRGANCVRLAGPLPNAYVQRESGTGKADVIQISRKGIITAANSGSIAGKKKSKKKKKKSSKKSKSKKKSSSKKAEEDSEKKS